jgi:hypothetical protein
MRRSLAIAAISGSLLTAGAIGAFVGNPVVSGAQEAAPSATATAKDAGARHHRPMRAGLETAATALGLSPEELRTQLRGGQTLGQIADARGVSRTDLVDTLVGAARTRTAEAVTAGRLTQEQADARLAQIEARLPEILDRARPAARGDHGADSLRDRVRGGHHGGRGFRPGA